MIMSQEDASKIYIESVVLIDSHTRVARHATMGSIFHLYKAKTNAPLYESKIEIMCTKWASYVQIQSI